MGHSTVVTFFGDSMFDHVGGTRVMGHRVRFLARMSIGRVSPALSRGLDRRGVIVRKTISVYFVRGNRVMVLSFGASEMRSVDSLVRTCDNRLSLCTSTTDGVFGVPVGRGVVCSFRLSSDVSFWGWATYGFADNLVCSGCLRTTTDLAIHYKRLKG